MMYTIIITKGANCPWNLKQHIFKYLPLVLSNWAFFDIRQPLLTVPIQSYHTVVKQMMCYLCVWHPKCQCLVWLMDFFWQRGGWGFWVSSCVLQTQCTKWMSLCFWSVYYSVASILGNGWTEVNRSVCVMCACCGDVLVWHIGNEDHSDPLKCSDCKHTFKWKHSLELKWWYSWLYPCNLYFNSTCTLYYTCHITYELFNGKQTVPFGDIQWIWIVTNRN